jgi:hypothetical protein
MHLHQVYSLKFNLSTDRLTYKVVDLHASVADQGEKCPISSTIVGAEEKNSAGRGRVAQIAVSGIAEEQTSHTGKRGWRSSGAR